MSNKHVNGTKRRHEEDGRSKRQEDIEEDYQRKRRRNSTEKSQELSKKQRRDARHSDDHSIDSKFPEWHDKEGHFNYRLGESLGDQLDSSEPERRRYKLIDRLGQGTFGLVLLAWDRIEQCFVAVKIVRAIKKYTESALFEIDILTRIQRSGLQEQEEESELEQVSSVSQSRDLDGDATTTSLDAAALDRKAKPKKLKQHIPKHCCITLESWFQYKEHICMVFQKYGLSLYDYLKQTHFKPLDHAMIKDIAYNLFASLYYLHEGLQLIHTDLKPENILFVDDCRQSRHAADGNKSPDIRSKSVLNSSEIKIIDLGSATFERDYHSTIISTRHYRAPEVILQVGWSFPSDVWSVGCILLELYTGRTCFQTHHNGEHLAMMEALLGEIPVAWLLANQEAKNNVIGEYFESGGDRFYKSLELKWYNNPSADSKRRVRAVKSLADIIAKEDEEFYQLIRKTLMIDPGQRLTASEALEAPYFDSVRENARICIYEQNNPNGAESKQLKRTVSASLDIGRDGRERKTNANSNAEQSTTPSNKRQLDEDRMKEANTAHHEAFLQLQEDEKRQKLEQVQQQLLLHQQLHQHRLQQQPSIAATNNNSNNSNSQHVQYQQYHLPLPSTVHHQQQASQSRDSEATMSHSKSRANSLSSGLVSHAPDDSPRYQPANATNSNANNNSNSHAVNSYHNYNRGNNNHPSGAIRLNNTNDSRYLLDGDGENDDIDSVPDRGAHLLDQFGFDSEKHNSQVAESQLSNLLLRSNSSFSRMDASTQSQPQDEKLA